MAQAEATRQISYIQAINEALRQELDRDPTVIVMGEDIAGGGEREDFQDAWGGPMRLTKGLVNEFGRTRIRDTPISEAGFVG
ncbi:MAG: alpha-ketoacid dehydrogenase subunit beta, partial [Chloroflexota bacterium]|nr:alpha-ketoacid dehydrogenase subunit beta [Chloroflexota bacterium]